MTYEIYIETLDSTKNSWTILGEKDGFWIEVIQSTELVELADFRWYRSSQLFEREYPVKWDDDKFSKNPQTYFSKK